MNEKFWSKKSRTLIYQRHHGESKNKLLSGNIHSTCDWQRVHIQNIKITPKSSIKKKSYNPVQKGARDLNRHLTKEQPIDMRKYTVALIFPLEPQWNINTITQQIRLIWKSNYTKCWWRYRATGGASYIASGGCKFVQSPSKTLSSKMEAI